MTQDLKERLLSRRVIDPARGCWLWTGTCNNKGYGQIHIGEKVLKLVHRVAYELFVGVLLATDKCLHSCDTTRCFNPEHLFKGTQARNMQDMVAKGRHHYQRKTHCKHGHPLTGDNVRLINGGRWRECRTCEGWNGPHGRRRGQSRGFRFSKASRKKMSQSAKRRWAKVKE